MAKEEYLDSNVAVCVSSERACGLTELNVLIAVCSCVLSVCCSCSSCCSCCFLVPQCSVNLTCCVYRNFAYGDSHNGRKMIYQEANADVDVDIADHGGSIINHHAIINQSRL
jgi:hypothetical protein